MRYVLALTLSMAALVPPVLASAAEMDATLVPDGTYVVKVEKVDTQHMTVLMQNGVETTVAPAGGADFTKLHASQTIKISMVKGKVPVYAVVTEIR